MDRNTLIGILLLFGLFYVYVVINAPTEEELAAQRMQDSVSALQNQQREAAMANQDSIIAAAADTAVTTIRHTQDSLPTKSQQGGRQIEKEVTIENEKISISFTTKGAQIKKVWLKEYETVVGPDGSISEEDKFPLTLMDQEENVFEYIIPRSNGGFISSSTLYFRIADQSSEAVRLIADLPSGGTIEKVFSLTDKDYLLHHEVSLSHLDQYIRPEQEISIHWVNQLNKLEKSSMYEQTYSTIHYKTKEESPDYCSWTGDDEEQVEEPLQWVSHSNQFFNSSIIYPEGFSGANLRTQTPEEDTDYLKTCSSMLNLPVDNPSQEDYSFDLYIGPNDFARLRDLGYNMEDIIPYGWSIFGTINRWVIRPIFEFFSSFVGSLGIAIIILTFVIKLALYPLTYRMLHSQAKMAALKPEIQKIKDKSKGDSQAQQMETMKLYREFGVNPLGGCMPMVLQMPIWFALYRFFPASIDFRQEQFLWANDLSSYDVIFQLPFSIPAYGDHVSLFTLLWAVSLFIYTYYNMRNMDTSMMQGNPMMKYMQYLMPVMFLFFLNSYASGLTCYLLFSNIFNISQNVLTKKFVFNEDRIKEELNKNKEKPKKQSGFRARLEQVMEEQRKQQERKNRK